MNHNEANILSLMVEAYAINAEIEGMKANDANGSSGTYSEAAYLSAANKLKDIAKEIKMRAPSLGS